MSLTYNIADLFELVADAVPEQLAVVCGDDRLTYGQLDAAATKLANYLAAQGVGAGDHIGLHLYNSAEFVTGSIAALKLRAVPINVNYRYVAHELRYIFEDAELVALVTQGGFLPDVEEAAEGNTKLRTIITAPDPADHPQKPENSALATVEFADALAAGSDERSFGERSNDDLYIIYTGGTTGMPRGVMWRHEDLFFAALQGGRPGGDDIEAPDELRPIVAAGDTRMNIHGAAPLIHGAAQLATWICLFTGGTVCLVPGRSFNAKMTCALIEAEQVNVVNLVGDAMARPFADELEAGDYDADCLFTLSSAGAVLSEVVKEKLTELLPYAMVLNNFGSSETGHQGTAMSTRGGAAKFIMHGHGTAVVDKDGNEIEPGSGKVGWLARTGHIPLGYYKAPEKTAATFVQRNGKRWVMPGDMAIPNEDGSITVLGRGSVCINTGGEKVFPEEVEEALKSHPTVQDAIVVGVPDERWGQRVEALVLLRDGAAADAAAVEAQCRSRVAGYKAPRKLHFVADLNRQPSGKPDYGWARKHAIALNDSAGNASAGNDSAGDQDAATQTAGA